MSSPIPRVNLAGMVKLIRASIASNTPLELIGAPGIGKTEIAEVISWEYANAIGGVVYPLVLSQTEPGDLGVPVPTSSVPGGPVDRLLRFPVQPIIELSRRGGVLFADEMANATSPVKAAFLTIVQGRYAGDFKLHPATRILAASNPIDMSEGGHEAGAPTLGRWTRVEVVPDHDEVRSHFETIGPEGSTLRMLALDLAATWGMDPNLLQLAPPPGSVRAGRGWGNPRSWKRALTLATSLIEAGESIDSEIVAVALSGNVSEETAGSWLATMKVRKDLPSKDEIVSDPIAAKLPGTREQEVACVGLLQHVALVSPESAWIYVDRLSEEIQTVSYRGLMRFALNKGQSKSKLINVAIQAQSRVMGRNSKAGALNQTGW
jgi:MoxR-like ATPase